VGAAQPVFRSQFGIEAQHPDEFIPHLIDLSPGAVVTAAKLQRQSQRNPPKSAEEFLDSLARQGLPETVVRLNGFAHPP
jgi:hypothetical protein